GGAAGSAPTPFPAVAAVPPRAARHGRPAVDSAALLHRYRDRSTTTFPYDASTETLPPVDETPTLHNRDISSQLRNRLPRFANRVLPVSHCMVARRASQMARDRNSFWLAATSRRPQ